MLIRMGDAVSEARELLQKVRLHQRRGLRDLVLATYGYFHQRLNFLYKIYVRLACSYFRAFKRRAFAFQGETYSYLYHPYNRTWTNERAVEIPLVWEAVQSNEGKRILEVGDVLSHYFPISHDVVDKYESGEGIVKEDVVDYQSPEGYDLIVSISTLEHVGWDAPEPRNPAKALQAIENLKSLCRPGGRILVTWGIGHNRVIDRMVGTGEIEFDELHCFKKETRDNEWKEASWLEVADTEFGHPYRGANGLLVGMWHVVRGEARKTDRSLQRPPIVARGR